MNNLILEFLGISETPIPCEKSVVESAFWKLIDLNQGSIINDLDYDSSPTNTYVSARDRAFDKLLMSFILKNTSFLFDYDLNEILDTNLMQNLPYPYNALSILKLNKKDTWNLMKSKSKPFVICDVCKTEVNWEFDENMSYDLKQRKCTNTISDNWYILNF